MNIFGVIASYGAGGGPGHRVAGHAPPLDGDVGIGATEARVGADEGSGLFERLGAGDSGEEREEEG